MLQFASTGTTSRSVLPGRVFGAVGHFLQFALAQTQQRRMQARLKMDVPQSWVN